MLDGDNSKRDSIFSASKGDERRTLNKIEIVSIRILERWDEAINTFQLWREFKVADRSNADNFEHKIRAVLYALFIMNKELFKRRLYQMASKSKKNSKSKDVSPVVDVFSDLSKMVLSLDAKTEDLELCFSIMNEVFDDLGLVRVDLDRKDNTLEELNKKKGFD